MEQLLVWVGIGLALLAVLFVALGLAPGARAGRSLRGGGSRLSAQRIST